MRTIDMRLDKEALRAWGYEIETELKDNILDFWMRYAVAEEQGGFVGEITGGMVRLPDAPKGLVLNARILWTFSCAYRVYRDDRYLGMARRAYESLRNDFRDREYGGFYWAVQSGGGAAEPKKQVYGQAFAIYGLTEYYRATGENEALERAKELYVLLEKHAYEPVHSGYYEALSRDWTPIEDMSLSGKDYNVPKSMNTHLHLLEAYTNLYRVWRPEGLRMKLAELIRVHLEKILAPGTGHFKLFFDEDWRPMSGHVSYGHDIEGSWLLVEAAETLGDEGLLRKAAEEAVVMARSTLAEGTDANGGIRNETDEDGSSTETKDWWPQAEAVVGFLGAYRLTGEEAFLRAARRSWAYIDTYIRDDVHGEWHWGVDGKDMPRTGEPKVSAWKCPYHNGRACFEAIARIESILREVPR